MFRFGLEFFFDLNFRHFPKRLLYTVAWSAFCCKIRLRVYGVIMSVSNPNVSTQCAPLCVTQVQLIYLFCEKWLGVYSLLVAQVHT